MESYDSIFSLHQETFLNHRLEPIVSRKEALSQLRTEIQNHENEIYSAFLHDLNKCREEVFMSELLPIYNEIDYFLKNIDYLMRPETVKGSLLFCNADQKLIKRPIGPVLIISPFNYPLNLSIVPLIGSIACGCPTTLYMSKEVPEIRATVKRILAALPREAVYYAETREGLLPRPFGCVMFTGSTKVGKQIQSDCSKFLNRCVLELGGCNPVIVTSNCNVIQACQQTILGKFFNGGQTCISPNFVLIERSVSEQYIDELKKEIAESFNKEQYCCKVISHEKYEELKAIVDKNEVIYQQNLSVCQCEDILPPTLLKCDGSEEFLKEEIFGNVLPIIEFSNLEQIYNWYRTNFYEKNLEGRPLAAYLFSDKKSEVEEFQKEISAGTICVNECLMFQIGELPFGGVGEAGLMRYHHEHSLECFCENEPYLEVKKSKMFGLGYLINSKSYLITTPPFASMPKSMIYWASRRNSLRYHHCIKWICLALLVCWAVGVTVALIIVQVR